jgi:hypothetical protein
MRLDRYQWYRLRERVLRRELFRGHHQCLYFVRLLLMLVLVLVLVRVRVLVRVMVRVMVWVQSGP